MTSNESLPERSDLELPDLIVSGSNLRTTVLALRLVLAEGGDVFERAGKPVHLTRSADGGLPIAREMKPSGVLMEVDRLCRPVKVAADGSVQPIMLPERVARAWLDANDWGLRSLHGITSTPVLGGDGSIVLRAGYDTEHGLWCEPAPHIDLPERPSQVDAEAALMLLRSRFATFPFEDAIRHWVNRVEVVDLSKGPGLSESAYLAALLTAVCRPFLDLAPGLLVSAPDLTGAGSGKGLLIKGACMIAYGEVPSVFTAGEGAAELDKRLAAELIQAKPAIFLDNVNATALRSDMLASVLTERPSRVRLLGSSTTCELNGAAFIAIAGNGLTVSEDLARRFMLVELDPRCEDPEQRQFLPGFLKNLKRDRAMLMAACLTIWRWGRQNELPRGLVLGSFEQWGAWCRDPLLALGCADPVQRIVAAKANDPRRRAIAELFLAWWDAHESKPLKAADLAEPVRAMLDPQRRGRQYVASRLSHMNGTRSAGYTLTMQPPAGKWSGATYALVPVVDDPSPAAEPEAHGTHRTDPDWDDDDWSMGDDDDGFSGWTQEQLAELFLLPMLPMLPMPDEVEV